LPQIANSWKVVGKAAGDVVRKRGLRVYAGKKREGERWEGRGGKLRCWACPSSTPVEKERENETITQSGSLEGGEGGKEPKGKFTIGLWTGRLHLHRGTIGGEKALFKLFQAGEDKKLRRRSSASIVVEEKKWSGASKREKKYSNSLNVKEASCYGGRKKGGGKEGRRNLEAGHPEASTCRGGN